MTKKIDNMIQDMHDMMIIRIDMTNRNQSPDSNYGEIAINITMF